MVFVVLGVVTLLMTRVNSDRTRVAMRNSIRGEWVLISADSQPAQHLDLQFGPDNQIGTNAGCNWAFANATTLSPQGKLTVTGNVFRTLKGCEKDEYDTTVLKALASKPHLRRVDSDLVLEGDSRLLFRLAFPTPATSAFLTSSPWLLQSLDDEPVSDLQFVRFGTRGTVRADTCGGVFYQRFTVDEAAILQLSGEAIDIPECALPVNRRLTALLTSQPRVEMYNDSLIVRSPTSVAVFSDRSPRPANWKDQPVEPPSERDPYPYPPRPAVPASDSSARGSWNVESINGIAAPPGMWVTFPQVDGFDGCNAFSVPRAKRSSAGSARRATFNNDGSMNAAAPVSTDKACPENGFTWDPRMVSVFRGLPIAEHIGDTLVVRSTRSEEIWVTLKRRAT